MEQLLNSIVECECCELELDLEEVSECNGLSCAISFCYASQKQFLDWKEFERQLWL
jgi:hypothetical protein